MSSFNQYELRRIADVMFEMARAIDAASYAMHRDPSMYIAHVDRALSSHITVQAHMRDLAKEMGRD